MTDEDTEETWDHDIHGKQRLFVLHYCTNEECFLNATAAYEAAYPDAMKSTAAVNGSNLLKKDKIKLAVQRLLKLAQAEIDETNVYKTLHDIGLLATFNPADVLNKAGKLKTRSLEDLGEKAKCIAQIRPSQYGPVITLVDRIKYLELISNYLNIVRPETQIDRSLPVITLPEKADDEAWNEAAQEIN